MNTSAHQFSFTSLTGKPLSLANYAGKALLVVNTASKCGFTPQYRGLEEIWRLYEDKGLVVLGVPSNDFGGQEPGSSEEIRGFCENVFHVSFPMTEKVKVTGPDAHPFYQWLLPQVGLAGKPRWNFYKYLLDRDGQLVDWFTPLTKPDSGKLTRVLRKVL